MPLSLYPASVPTGLRDVKAGTCIETICFCSECWTECTPRQIMTVFGRELCPDCGRAEENAYAEFNAPSEEFFWNSVASDRMDKLSTVLSGMGYAS